MSAEEEKKIIINIYAYSVHRVMRLFICMIIHYAGCLLPSSLVYQVFIKQFAFFFFFGFVLSLIQGSYMTIHITPEPEFSYVSFETNVPLSSYEELIRRVVRTFQPGKFVVTLFANGVRSAVAEIPFARPSIFSPPFTHLQSTLFMGYRNLLP